MRSVEKTMLNDSTPSVSFVVIAVFRRMASATAILPPFRWRSAECVLYAKVVVECL
jgi:hypothetical protein